MFMALQLVSGLREQFILTFSFTSLSLVMVLGAVCELWSRPGAREADGYRGWAGDPPRTPKVVAIMKKRNVHKQDTAFIDALKAPTEQKDTVLSRLRRRFANDHNRRVTGSVQLTADEKRVLHDYNLQYVKNFVFRLIPHFLGWWPYLVTWSIFISHFVTQLNDVKQIDPELYDRIPPWVTTAIAGTAVLFTSFTFVQLRYMFLSPDVYWRTELWYCLLSLTAKVFLGSLLLVNVLRFSRFEDGV
jgi:hypothetical protein